MSVFLCGWGFFSVHLGFGRHYHSSRISIHFSLLISSCFLCCLFFVLWVVESSIFNAYMRRRYRLSKLPDLWPSASRSFLSLRSLHFMSWLWIFSFAKL